MQQYGTVGEKNWSERPVYIVGGGSSLRPHAKKLWLLYQRGFVVAVNDSHLHCYFPDAIFTLDHLWLEKNIKKIEDMPGPVFAAVDKENPRVESKNLTYLKRTRRLGISEPSPLSEDATVITNGMNSGYGALNLAFLKGAKIIYLLGFDFKEIENKAHFHAGYPWHNRTNSNRMFPYWAKAFEDTTVQLNKYGVHVFNCSPDSLVTCFPRKSYDEVL